jgi:putative PEP-CTERM system TPR-repeat lipoprotein
MNTRNLMVGGFLVALAVTLLAACGEKPEGLVASAKEYLAKGDQKAAVIQLRSALQKNNDLAEARFLLGRALLDIDEIPAAEKELRKALELKYPTDQVVPTLVRALVTGGQYKKAIDEFGRASAGSPQGTAELKAALGQAHMAIGNTEKGKAAFAAALAAQPDYAPAILGTAEMKAADGDLPGALASIDAALVKTPTFAEGWLFKGRLLMARSQRDEALDAFRKAVVAKPDFVPAHEALVTLLMTEGKTDEASTQLDAMKKVAPRHPRTLFLQAVLAYHKKDFAAARDAVQLQLRVAPDDLQGRLLSGAVSYELKSYAAAETSLSKVLNAVPGQLSARRLLIATYLQSGQPDKALQTLKPVLGVVDKDPALSALAGEVYLRNDQPAEAAKYFALAAALDPQNSGGRLGLAVSHLATGQTDTAFQELESAAAESAGAQADLILIRSALARQEFDKALAATDALEKKQPNTPLVRNLRGVVLFSKGDAAGASKQFEAALAIDPAFFPAAANLARLDLANKKPEEAKKRFDAVLAKDPKNVGALLALAELSARNGGSAEEVASMIEKAIAADPNGVLPRLTLIAHWLGAKDPKQAVAAGQSALAALPDQPEILLALGAAQLVAGDTSQALANYNKLAQLDPKSPVPLLRVAEAQMAGKDKEAALQTLRKALALQPDMVEAQRGIVMLEVEGYRTSKAVAMARAVQKQRPKDAIGNILEGDSHSYRKSWGEAATAYRAGLKQVDSGDLAAKLHVVLNAEGNAKEAEQFAASWTKDHPKDSTFRLYLTETALAKNDYAAGAREYRALLDIQPNNAMVLNNLGWASGQVKDPKAIEYAEKANKLAPDQPEILDTLDTLLVAKGDAARYRAFAEGIETRAGVSVDPPRSRQSADQGRS